MPTLKPRAPGRSNAPPSPRLHSRRRPRLRVVGTPSPTTRHATVVTIAGVNHVVEVWTFAELETLAKAEKPERAWLIPGLGWMVVRLPDRAHEIEDIVDVRAQAYAELGG